MSQKILKTKLKMNALNVKKDISYSKANVNDNKMLNLQFKNLVLHG